MLLNFPSMEIELLGHAATQYLQPLHSSLSIAILPLGFILFDLDFFMLLILFSDYIAAKAVNISTVFSRSSCLLLPYQ